METMRDMSRRTMRPREYVDSSYFEPLGTCTFCGIELFEGWLMEVEDASEDEYILRLRHPDTAHAIAFRFPDPIARMEFARLVHTDTPVEQLTKGVDLESVINSNLETDEAPALQVLSRAADDAARMVSGILSLLASRVRHLARRLRLRPEFAFERLPDTHRMSGQ